MAFGRKKKKKEETLPEPEEQEEEQEETLPTALKEKKKKAETKKAAKPIGKFSLDENEMALAVNALAGSEEFKIYQQAVIGEQIAVIIDGYNKAVGGKESEIPSSEDTEEGLPEPE